MKASLKDIFKTAAAALAMLSASLLYSSCGKDREFEIEDNRTLPVERNGSRKETAETRRVLLFYEAGFNNLANYLYEDIEKELAAGWLPGNGRNENVVLVYSKLAMSDDGETKRFSDYSPRKSYLRRIYADPTTDGIIADTIMVFDESRIASSPETMREVLEAARKVFPAKGYGMIFSSHGSGWLPQDYYYSPSDYERSHRGEAQSVKPSSIDIPRAPVPQIRLEDDPFFLQTRSIGRDESTQGGTPPGKEMTTAEFAAGIPYKLDFIFFDMCLSAGAEVFYALKDKAGLVGASCAEVLAEGMFNYDKLTGFLLEGREPDYIGLFQDSFDKYNSQSAELYRSSTVTLVRTDGMERLGEVCKDLFEKYSYGLDHLNYRNVQGFYRQERHYFFDLEDALRQSGASEEDLAMLEDALAGCIMFKAATPNFLSTFRIKFHCGMTIYLPCAGTYLLDKNYLKEAWNIRTGLVK